jgi:nitrite reductase (NADH) small subunit
MSDWMDVGELEAIPRQGARRVETPAGDIALFRAGTGQVFALRDSCPHRGGPLSQGMVYGNTVACPLHSWSIDLETGEAVAPDEGCTDRYEVRVNAGRVELRLD